MLRTAVSLICALAVLSPAVAFAGERYDRRDNNRHRTIERVQTIDFGNRNRTFHPRDYSNWERRDAGRERTWRDRRDDRRDYRRDRRYDRRQDRHEYRRDRDRSRIIIIPRISF